jgi:hypothetical protein
MVNVGYALIAQVVVNPPTTRSRPRHPLMLSTFFLYRNNDLLQVYHYVEMYLKTLEGLLVIDCYKFLNCFINHYICYITNLYFLHFVFYCNLWFLSKTKYPKIVLKS